MDGTVLVVHSGSEMGQGINVKVMQAVAGTLGIPMSLVSVSGSNTLARYVRLLSSINTTCSVCEYLIVGYLL